jgi:predicted ATP-binding protein involved in virulence
MNTIKSWDDAMARSWQNTQIAEIATQALEDIKNSNKNFSHSIVERAFKAINEVRNSK